MSSAPTCLADEERVLALRDLRRIRGLSQMALANRLRVTQPNIAKLEHQDDMYLSSLRRYVEAMGGELELVIRFPGERFELAGLAATGEMVAAE